MKSLIFRTNQKKEKIEKVKLLKEKMKYINTKLQSRKRRFETDSIISDNCSSVEFEVVRPTLVNSESQKHLQMLVNDSQRKVSP